MITYPRKTISLKMFFDIGLFDFWKMPFFSLRSEYVELNFKKISIFWSCPEQAWVLRSEHLVEENNSSKDGFWYLSQWFFTNFWKMPIISNQFLVIICQTKFQENVLVLKMAWQNWVLRSNHLVNSSKDGLWYRSYCF